MFTISPNVNLIQSNRMPNLLLKLGKVTNLIIKLIILISIYQTLMVNYRNLSSIALLIVELSHLSMLFQT